MLKLRSISTSILNSLSLSHKNCHYFYFSIYDPNHILLNKIVNAMLVEFASDKQWLAPPSSIVHIFSIMQCNIIC